MPGPLTHNTINKQIFWNTLLSQQLQPHKWFWFWEGIMPDIKKFNNLSHGWDFTKNQPLTYSSGTSIFAQLKVLYEETLKLHDKKKLHKKIYHISHLIADSLSVGQMSSRLWGKKDDMIDLRMETILFKCKDVRNTFTVYKTFDAWMKDLYYFASRQYNSYHAKAVLENLTRKDMRKMTRFLVSQSVSMMLSLLYLIEKFKEN